MKKTVVYFALLLSCCLQSCTNDREAEKKEPLRQQTEKIGQDAVKAIKTPLEQARMAAEQENSHSQTMEHTVGKQ
jgi:hypothetical protein